MAQLFGRRRKMFGKIRKKKSRLPNSNKLSVEYFNANGMEIRVNISSAIVLPIACRPPESHRCGSS
jgi:hypothetical protein